MTELKHMYAYNSRNEVVSIDKANSKEKYYYKSEGLNLEMIVREGEKNRKHFSVKGDGSQISESSFHYNAKMFIASQGYIEIEGFKLKPHEILVEKKTISDRDLLPDITFLDEQRNILCLIEIAVTHECSKEKIKELENRNILTIELYYDDNHREHTGFKFIGSKITDRVGRLIDRVESFRKKISAASGLSDRTGGVKEQINKETAGYRDKIMEMEKRANGEYEFYRDKEVRDKIKNLKENHDRELREIGERNERKIKELRSYCEVSKKINISSFTPDWERQLKKFLKSDDGLFRIKYEKKGFGSEDYIRMAPVNAKYNGRYIKLQ